MGFIFINLKKRLLSKVEADWTIDNGFKELLTLKCVIDSFKMNNDVRLKNKCLLTIVLNKRKKSHEKY